MPSTSRRLAHLRVCAVIAALSILLTACFDLAQRIEIDRHGVGHYRVSIAAQGLVGEALKETPVELGLHGVGPVSTAITDRNGLVTQTASVAFARLSDLRLSDDVVSLQVLQHTLFGLGPTHVRFRRTFLIGNARRHNQSRVGGDRAFGARVMASVFGDHTYVFAVTLPGAILHIAPVKLGDALVVPAVTGDFYHGHTVTWTMPLYLALGQKRLTFEVDFSAWGSFANSESLPAGARSL